MTNFEFYSPTRVLFGKGVLSRIGEESAAYGKKALFLYGKESLKKSGLYDFIKSETEKAGISLIEFGGVEPNPVLSHALAAIELARKESVDFIIAAGGGSVIDEAKGIAAGFYGKDDLWDYYSKKSTVEKALPIVAVQTQPATSSETNQVGVLTNPERGEKFGLRSPLLIPKLAFLDPEVTFSIPVQYTAYACFDIMSHLFEGYFTTTADFSPVQDGFVEGMVKAVMVSLERILKEPEDYEARASVMWAAALAWNGLSNAGLDGAHIPCHMLEHPMSALYNISHGAGLSIVTPVWLKSRKKQISNRIIKFGQNILELEGLENRDVSSACDLVIEKLEDFLRNIACPLSFAEAGIHDIDVDELTKQAMTLSELWNIKGYTEDEIKKIYNQCS